MKLRSLTVLNKLHEKEKKFKKELAKTFLEYLDTLSAEKRIEQIESILYETNYRNLPTLDRRLTPQEKKCLHFACRGKEVKEIANLLKVSQRTVKYHRSNIIKKLQVPNITAAVASNIQHNTSSNLDDICLSLNSYQNYQMFPEKIQVIANALDEIFNINLFLIHQNGKIHWANKSMLECIRIPELHLIQGKHVSFFGDRPWINTKRVVETKKTKIICEKFQGKKFLTIKVPYLKNEFYGVIGLSIDITNVKLEISSLKF